MKKMKIPSLVTLGVLTLITIAAWIGFSVVRIFTNKSVEKIPNEILTPLNPNLDQTAVEKINQRIYFDKEQTVEIILPSPSPSPSPSPTEIPAETSVPATESGEASL